MLMKTIFFFILMVIKPIFVAFMIYQTFQSYPTLSKVNILLPLVIQRNFKII